MYVMLFVSEGNTVESAFINTWNAENTYYFNEEKQIWLFKLVVHYVMFWFKQPKWKNLDSSIFPL